MDSGQLRDLVIVPTLKDYNLYSPRAVNLLLGTCAQESHMGKWLKQLKGPALGIYQVEPPTYRDVLDRAPTAIVRRMRSEWGFTLREGALIYDLRYATLISRLFYWLIPKPIPTSLEGQAKYWKRYYNTYLGSGTYKDYIRNYNRFVK